MCDREEGMTFGWLNCCRHKYGRD